MAKKIPGMIPMCDEYAFIASSGEYHAMIATKAESLMNGSYGNRHAFTKKKNTQQAVAAARLLTFRDKPRGPVDVCLTRLAPRKLDRHDNLPTSMKYIVDEIAAWLGRDDGDERWMSFEYKQEKSLSYGVRITITPRI